MVVQKWRHAIFGKITIVLDNRQLLRLLQFMCQTWPDCVLSIFLWPLILCWDTVKCVTFNIDPQAKKYVKYGYPCYFCQKNLWPPTEPSLVVLSFMDDSKEETAVYFLWTFQQKFWQKKNLSTKITLYLNWYFIRFNFHKKRKKEKMS